MRTTILLIFIILGVVDNLVAKNKQIIIGGFVQKQVTEYYQTNELIIRFKRTTHGSSTERYLKIPLMPDGSFKTILTDTEALSYVAFEFEEKKSGAIFNASFPKQRTLAEVYLLQEGDSVMVDIQKDGNLSFTGKGSEKLNCEWQIYNLPAITQSVERRVYDHDNFLGIQSKLKMLDCSVDLAIKSRLLILESYKDQISENIYNMLLLDLWASAQHTLSSRIHSLPVRILGHDQTPILQYYDLLLNQVISKFQDTTLAAESAYFTELLYEMEYSVLNLNSKYKLGSRIDFGQLYERFKSNYKGKLRDKLILLSFEIAGDASKAYIDDALKIVQDSMYKRLLLNLTQNRNTAFPFEFYDIHNKIHKLSDYKGKLVILETWFYGCIPCKALSEAMYPIFEKYKKNENIAFITVGTDQIDIWIRGIESGQYSNCGMIELHTNGEGFKNPFFRHYNFQGAPHQIIINRNGELIAIDPPRPIDTESIKAFSKMIDYSL